MGKVEEEQPLPTSFIDEAQSREQNAGNSNRRCCSIVKKLLSFRCVLALLLGVGVLLSAVFWLPFFHFGDQKDLDLDPEFEGHPMVASFMLDKPASFLEDYILRLGDDIFDEISFPTTKVEIISLESSAGGSNATNVIFAVDSDAMTRSLIRDAFVSLIIHQSSLRLTASLFGDPFSFEVLKFLGGITVSPQQSAFLMQKVHILFSFTLNFSIQQLQNNFDQLRGQLKSGLHLATYENLYISLLNLRGSTVAPPTIIQCQVLLAVGIPSMSRIKQLAQTITDSHGKNLGLNNTVFGRVKQVRLSSVLQHSLGGTGSPSPAPTPHPQHQQYHRHHHHHHHPDPDFVPAISPSPRTGNSGYVAGESSPTPAPVHAPAPTQGTSHKGKPPSCRYGNKKGFPRDGDHHSHLTPILPPTLSPKTAHSPKQQNNPPRPTVHQVPASSPLPHVRFAHVQPPSQREFNAEPPDLTPSVSPSSSSFPDHYGRKRHSHAQMLLWPELCLICGLYCCFYFL